MSSRRRQSTKRLIGIAAVDRIPLIGQVDQSQGSGQLGLRLVLGARPADHLELPGGRCLGRAATNALSIRSERCGFSRRKIITMLCGGDTRLPDPSMLHGN